MNTADRELMQQALDALEIAETDGNYYYEATELLRKRLAHCDLCGKRLGGEGDIHTCTPDPIGDAQDKLIAELSAQPEQEPVAWGVFDGPNLHDMFFSEEAAQYLASLKGVGSVVRPLTTPPAAQPAMFGPMGTVGDLFDKHVIANGNLKKEWIVYLERNT
jgi:hypothetical protein